MVYLILCILSSTGIFLVFKFLDQKNLPPFPAIIINYLIASFLGFVISGSTINAYELLQLPWIPISIVIGFMFIMMFFIIARSSKEAGISITTLASKMSVVFPIVISMVLDSDDRLTVLKSIAIIAALAGVLLAVYSPSGTIPNRKKLLIPLVLFAGMGLVDSLVKFAQYKYIGDEDAALFSAVLFTMAFFSGLIILPFREQGIREFRKLNIWLWGIILGIANFGSIYLIVSALNYKNKTGAGIDSSIIFGANNIGIVSLSVIAGFYIFKEKLKMMNWIGVAISALALILFAVS